ncbi:hypothetical protein WKH31_14210 [Metabacillus indicus]|uniref:TcaA NTF2-like domain-containing protein n=1 Tax=Metabacillus indicus TaxID=246786 RepID=UPI00316D2E41
MMKIEGFKLHKKLFSTEKGLTVFDAKNIETNKRCMIRIMDSRENSLAQDSWYAIHQAYQMEVSNYKYLPRVTTVAMLNNTKLYSVLELEEGKSLTKKGEITLEQIEHLLEAVRHLHSKNIIHGSINSDNIWITDKENKLMLYGSKETEALINEKSDIQTDLNQLVNIIKYFSSVNEKIVDELERNTPLTLSQISLKVEEAKKLDPRKKKPKLVETKKLPVTPPSLPEQKNDEQKRPVEETKTYENQERQKQQDDKNHQQTREETTKKQSSGIWKAVAGLLAVAIVILLVINVISPGKEKIEKETMQPVAEATEIIKPESDEKEVLEEPAPAKPSVPVETKLTVNYTTEEVENFMGNYSKYSIQAVNERNFALVENLVDPDGQAYTEQRDYIGYLESEGITEKSEIFKVKEITKVDETTYEVSTYEKYHIFYGDGSEKKKDFNSEYILKILEDGRLTVHKLISSDEISTQEIQTVEDEYTDDYSEDFETENYTEEYSDEFAPVATEDSGAIESVVRLHYASITNDDFTKAYDLFSSSRKQKITQNGWEKGLQQNISDELTYIEVEQIEATKGRAYIEMTSYDDNSDGSTLVQNWNGYWHVVKENGRWVLDVAEITKINSRVE